MISRSAVSTEETVTWGAGPKPCRVTYTERRLAVLPRIEAAAYHDWQLPSGREWITFHRADDAYVLCFPELAHFRVSPGGAQVHCDALQDVPEETVRHLLGQVLPLVANGQGVTVLHAGAVEVDDGAVAFLGPTGRGKSTLTAAFAAQGHRFLTDDALQLALCASGRPFASPGQPHLRLWKDSERMLAAGASTADDATPKARVPAGRRFPQCDSERALTAMYLLDEGTQAEPAFEPIRPAAAFLELLRNSFLLDPRSPVLLQAQHDRLAAVAARVPVFRMRYARRYESLAQVCRETVAHARSSQPIP